MDELRTEEVNKMIKDHMNWFEDDELKDVELPEFDRLCIEMGEQNKRVKALKDDLKDEQAKLDKMKAKILAYLEHYNKSKYVSPAGTIYISNRFSASVPKEEAEKEKLFTWMQEKGIYLQYATVNTNSLSSLYKSLLETEGPDFRIPGVGEPTTIQILGIRSK